MTAIVYNFPLLTSPPPNTTMLSITMPIAFTHKAQEITYHKVTDYLKTSNLFKDSLAILGDRPNFTLQYGSAMVEIEVLNWEFHPWEARDMAIVKASSCVTVGSQVDEQLMMYLLNENRRMRFGAFHLGETGQVWFADSVLGGEGMDLMELQSCILAVVTVADTYDDIIVEKFGGQRAVDRQLEPRKTS